MGGAPRTGDLLGSDSGDAAMLVRDEWQRRLDAGLVTVGMADELHRDAPLGHPGLAVSAALVLAMTVWALAATG